MNYDSIISDGLQKGFSFVKMFGLLLNGKLVNEEPEKGAKHRLQVKKEAFGSLYNILVQPRPDDQNASDDTHHPLVEKYDALILFFSDSKESIRVGRKFGLSEQQLSLRCSFDSYCDIIQKLVENFPELEEQFEVFTYHLFLISYHYYELLMLEETHRINEQNKYGPKEMDYITYLRWSITNFRKNQNSNGSEETKAKYRAKMKAVFWFSEGNLEFEEQLKYLEAMTERSNQNTYVLGFLRRPLIKIIQSLEGNGYTRRKIYLDFFELIPFLDPRKKIRGSYISEYDGYYNKYKYKTSQRYFSLK